MDEVTFNSLEELYNRLLPALRTKKDEFRLMKFGHITEKDIWIYLTETKWKSAHNLLLYQMVDDIMCADYIQIDKYMKKRSKEK